MATKYKRTTVKTGPFSRRTTTISKSGTRITTSNKPPGAATRRTFSTNLKTGKSRITYTTKQGGGWFSTSSKTFGGSKSRSSGGTRRRRSSGGGGGGGDIEFVIKFWKWVIIIGILVWLFG